MPKPRWAILAIACVLNVSLAHAATSDTAAPHVAIKTPDRSILINLYAVQERLGGTATDDRSGVDRVEVTFDGLAKQATFTNRADLGCTDVSQKTCNWLVLPPLAPGQYVVTVRAFDGAGNASVAKPNITIVVA